MKKFYQIIIGLACIAVGAIISLNAFGVTNIDLLFDGWWTLFIIIPCLGGVLTDQDKTASLFGLFIGVFLLLCCQEIVQFSLLWKLLLPVAIILIGLRLIIQNIFGGQAEAIFKEMGRRGEQPCKACAVFEGKTPNFVGAKVEGIELDAIFGGVKCDLRQAVIEKNCAIQVAAVFGGITIYVPENVNVKVSTNSLFGGVTNKAGGRDNAITIYVSGFSLFGGVEIK